MEQLGLGEEVVCSGCKLVPWQSWYEWNYVRECLFSSSPTSVSTALRRISAWRSRGCLPVAVAVTTIIIETQQRDPFFREGLVDDGSNSDEMLSMAYSMAIMRLVNGFVEQSNKKTRLSIADTAEAIGLPRLLIDIRHEGSHRDLPSLPLLRLGSSKALNWLKSYYWEPQKHLVPDIRKEIKSRLRKMALYIKVKQGLVLNLQLTGRCQSVKQSELLCGWNKLFSHQVGKLRSSKSTDPKKQMTKIVGSLIRLYSASPSEVVAVLLEEFLSKTCGLSDGTGLSPDSSQGDISPGDLRSLATTVDDWKVIIMKLSSKEPELLLMMLKVVLDKIENSGALTSENDELYDPSPLDLAETDVKRLSSLVYWLVKILKKLKKSNRLESIVESPKVFPSQGLAIPGMTLTELLRKCLMNMARGTIHLSDSVHILLQLIGKSSSTELLKKLLMMMTPKQEFELKNDDLTDRFDILRQQEDNISRAKRNLEILKVSRKKKDTIGITVSTGDDMDGRNPWTVAKSWSPCPIGMLPCPFSSYGVLPVLEKAGTPVEGPVFVKKGLQFCEENIGDNIGFKRDATPDLDLVEYPGCVKKAKKMENGKLDDLDEFSKFDDQGNFSPMDGQLLVGGCWKKVGIEELQAIESDVHILI